ncbi:hypothetical protein TNCT_237681 [Trichonephila clavata]|uniref:Uncharacterized protein n=1 Tax=Trichonephila clavata TaxID=2740835 RepID=A0A8X6GMD8_TRICU|nr:hypothetical protein TNCT_237681 [Trichonephila clavata]
MVLSKEKWDINTGAKITLDDGRYFNTLIKHHTSKGSFSQAQASLRPEHQEISVQQGLLKGMSWPRVRGSALSGADAVPRLRNHLRDEEKERHWSHECSEASIAGSLPKEVEGLHDGSVM